MATKERKMENMVATNNLAAFYKNKNVFLTGHTGFKGAWLSAWLHKLGAKVHGYALPPEYHGGIFGFLHKETFILNEYNDIRDREKLKKALLSASPDIVFHLAAQPLVRRSYQHPLETYETNVLGTANLLDAVRSLEKKCVVVVITTDKVYENKETDTLYQETDVLGGYDPYSCSKACAELVTASYKRSFFHEHDYPEHQKSIATARAGNVIGGGDWGTDRIIPDIVRSLSKSQEIDVRNPTAVRPWQHVLEPLSGYLSLANLLYNSPETYSNAYNFGPMPNDHLTVSQLVETAIKSWGSGAWKDRSNPQAVHEAGLLKLDITKAINELGWKPKLVAQQAIDWSIQWYKQPQEKKLAYTLQQINTYQQL